MAKLVADYGSESDSDDPDRPQSTNKTESEAPLPKPGFDDDVKKRSILVNPFIEEDNTKKAILEKHVKMISVNAKTINGKKICWNYRKSKCRFGQNCKFAHDSDLQIDKSKIKLSETNVKQVDVRKYEQAVESKKVKKKNKRGVGPSIEPPKKVMRHYYEQKIQDNN